MYCEFFGLRCLPFEDRADTQFTFLTPEFEETLARLEYEGRYGDRSLLITGDAGTGKTQLIRTYMLRIHATDHVVVVTCPVDGSLDLIREICKGFGVTVSSSGASRSRRLSRLQRHLARIRSAEHRAVFIIDQAENLTPETLAQVGHLVDLQNEQGKLLSVILVGQPRIHESLIQPELVSLKQQLLGHCVLSPLTAPQTREYIRTRLRVAGAGDADLFDGEAVAWIHRASHGLPRLINHFGNVALLAAYGAAETRVTQMTLLGLNEAGLECERTVPAHELGLSVRDVVAPALPAKRHSAAQSTNSSHVIAATMTSETDSIPPPTIWYASPGGDDMIPPPFSKSPPETAIGESVAHSMETLFIHGEALLERLERALSRADRMATTTEASLSQFTAVERHVSTLVQSAERLIVGLKEGANRADANLHSTQRTADELLHAVQQRGTQLDVQVHRATQVSVELTEQLSGVTTAIHGGTVLESRLSSFAAELADQSEEVQGRIGELMTGMRDTSQARISLEELTRSSTSALQQQCAAARSRQAELQATAERVERLRDEFNDTTIAATSRAIQDTVRNAERSMRDAAAHALVEWRDTLDKDGRSWEQSVKATTANAKTEILQAATTFSDSELRISQSGQQLITEIQRVGADERRQIEQTTSAIADAIGAQLQQITDHAAVAANKAEVGLARVRSGLDAAIQEWSQHENSAVHRACVAMKDKLTEQLEIYTRLHEQRVTAALADHRARAEAVITETQPRLDEIVRRVVHVQSQRDALADSLITLGEETRVAQERAQTVEENLRRSQTVAEESGSRAETASQTLCSAIERGDDLFDRVQALRGQLDELHRGTTNHLNELARTEERSKQLRDQTIESERSSNRLDMLSETAHQLINQLTARVADAKPIEAAITLATAGAATHLRQLDSHNAAVTHTVRELSAETVTARRLVDEVRTVNREADAATAVGRQQIQQLTGLEADRVRAVDQLTEWTATARQLHEELQVGLKGAAPTIQTLSCQSESARVLSTDLATAEANSRSMVHGARQVIHQAEQAATTAEHRLKKWIGKGCLMNAKAEAVSRNLATQVARADQVASQLNESAAPADRLLNDLTSVMTGTGHRLDELNSACDQAGSIIKNLGEIEQLVSAINRAEQTIRQITEEAAPIQRDITSLIAAANQHSVRLETLNVKSNELIVDHERITTDSAAALRRLSDHLVTIQSFMDSGQTLLRNVVEQCETMDERIKELTEESGRIEKSLMDAASAPTAAVESAKTQVAQLDRVCAAVRKVFAGLSQATLDARDRTLELQNLRQDTDSQLSGLLEHTERAAHSLQEWVEEAIRAQDRLERSLRDCPSLSELYSRDRLLGPSKTASTLSRLREYATSGQSDDALEPSTVSIGSAPSNRDSMPIDQGRRSVRRDHVISNPDPKSQPTHEPAHRDAAIAPSAHHEQTAKLQSRAAEIAQMIEEAKRAACPS